MYLKSIEMHGFKSFANKMKFEFHNGITGIVGPNGSGKSNVSDAVRWVLGEQSAKQLRGASMQDVIFAGTENRKPLSYAYVSITLDNSDHVLPVDYEEVTISRRVYRSGESEYLMNGTACRLRDVNELFYDTGIGKEGYSIIGQGQIEKILSGKPEERRELFDEAVGIVKYKKRKIAAVKKLEQERDNLVRINDILKELERQVGPLERQAETAKKYLAKKEELKKLDVNMFLLEIDRLSNQLDEISKNFKIADEQMQDSKKQQEEIKEQYSILEQNIEEVEAHINEVRETQSNNTLTKGNLENQIKLLEEQIRSAEHDSENIESRKAEILVSKKRHEEEKDQREEERAKLQELLDEANKHLETVRSQYQALQAEIRQCNEQIEADKNEIMSILDNRSNIKSKEQRMKTMLEQTNIRKAELNQRIVTRQTQENALNEEVAVCQKAYEEADSLFNEIASSTKEMYSKKHSLEDKKRDEAKKLEELKVSFHKSESRLESLKNIAERYDGYGNSIKKVMELKSQNPALLGVISDIITADKKYEVAIETALGGNIQNIVTEDEACAKKMISYLKENRLGRATFLPLTSCDGRGNFKKTEVLSENGVINLASELVKADKKYDGVVAYLLGRVVVCDTIENALKIAKKYSYSLHIVTLEGEYLSPGGSLTGGKFKNNNNLLGRNREIEELEVRIAEIKDQMEASKKQVSEYETAIDLVDDDIKENQTKSNEAALARNTAKVNLEAINNKKAEYEKAFSSLKGENEDIEKQINDIEASKKEIAKELEDSNTREAELHKEIEDLTQALDEKTYNETSFSRSLSEAQIDEASARQKVTFLDENLVRIIAEIAKDNTDLENLLDQSKNAEADCAKKKADIEDIKKTIISADENYAALEAELKDSIAKKDAMSAEYKTFFDKREEVANRIADLDKEIYRLDAQREKAEESLARSNDYMWNEYELTKHTALELRDDTEYELPTLRKMISEIKDEIRHMGNVNVNAIEEYKEVSERYNFLKGQHDDLVEAEETLVGIIEELDTGMRDQFTKGFADIQREFDKSFKELFGGGKGTLELVEGEDILETGIKIIAQPPGKALKNMMQLSGGEKSLTAIALLFAIQNLKPSPFCLLDEIEAALDDSNVGRFANYLHKLTNNTQFIVITHRRGTMGAADRLYGITMQEKGVSSLVSVNLIEDALDE